MDKAEEFIGGMKYAYKEDDKTAFAVIRSLVRRIFGGGSQASPGRVWPG
jgi:hypothetical protein